MSSCCPPPCRCPPSSALGVTSSLLGRTLIRSKALMSDARSKHVFLLPAFETLPRLSVLEGIAVAEKAVEGMRCALACLANRPVVGRGLGGYSPLKRGQ